MKTFHVDGLAAMLKVICGNGHTHNKVMALKRRNPPDGPEHESDQTSMALKGLRAWDRLSKPRMEIGGGSAHSTSHFTSLGSVLKALGKCKKKYGKCKLQHPVHVCSCTVYSMLHA